MFDLSKIFNVSKKFALLDTFLILKNYCKRFYEWINKKPTPAPKLWSH